MANNIWYAYSYCPEREDFRSFALHRIKSTSLTKEVFTKDESVIKSLNNQSPFSYKVVSNVEVIASAEVAHRIAERNWFPNQQYEFLSDGSLSLKYEVVPENMLVSWILSYGGELIIVAPVSTRKVLSTKIKKLSESLDINTNSPGDL